MNVPEMNLRVVLRDRPGRGNWGVMPYCIDFVNH
jgi:hypothetical protein